MASLFRVTGLKEVKKNLATYQKHQLKETEKRAVYCGLKLQRESQKIVPIDLSPLKSSAETGKLPTKNKRFDIAVFYDKYYAAYVHEDLNARHKPGKVAKYLEGPLRRLRPTFLKILAGKIK